MRKTKIKEKEGGGDGGRRIFGDSQGFDSQEDVEE